MRYELTDFEWAAIRPLLPNKPCGWRWAGVWDRFMDALAAHALVRMPIGGKDRVGRGLSPIAENRCQAFGRGSAPSTIDLPDVGQISLINSHRFISLIRSSMARNRLRLKANFVSGFKPIGLSSPDAKNISFRNSEIVVPSACPAPLEGARDRHERGAGCDGRGGAVDAWR
jgi:hypothetical protein